MRLIHRPALQMMQPHFSVGGSHFSPEMMILALILRLRTIEVSLNYAERRGVSKITGNFGRAVRVGLAMIGLIVRYRLTSGRVQRPILAASAPATRQS